MPKINPDILRWARETSGMNLEEAAKKINLRDAHGIAAADRLFAIESGEQEPTRPLLLRMAKQYRRPLLTFYMSAPPQKGDRGKDFRTLPAGYTAADDALLDVLIRDVQARQSMIKAVLEDEEEANPLWFVSSAKMADGLSTILSSIQETLQIDRNELRATKTPFDAFGLLRKRTEDLGVFVLLIGNLGSYHTTIDLETFRGFALADSIAPFIIINDQDTHSAWSFTLLHELVHLWLGQTGISGSSGDNSIERFCNEVAGEFLLSRGELSQLQVSDTTDFDMAQTLISEFARNRHLSSSMVAYKLYNSGAISHQTWKSLSEAFHDKWLEYRSEHRKKARGLEGGPNYYTVRQHRLGNALVELVGRMVTSGALTTLKAGKVLGIKAKNVQTLIDIVKLA